MLHRARGCSTTMKMISKAVCTPRVRSRAPEAFLGRTVKCETILNHGPASTGPQRHSEILTTGVMITALCDGLPFHQDFSSRSADRASPWGSCIAPK